MEVSVSVQSKQPHSINTVVVIFIIIISSSSGSNSSSSISSSSSSSSSSRGTTIIFLEFYKSHKGAKVPLFLSVVLTDHLYQLYY